MVTPTGFEPVTCPLGGDCSIQLSHGAAVSSIGGFIGARQASVTGFLAVSPPGGVATPGGML